MRRAVASVDLGAVERNCSRLAAILTNGASLCAVVKADGYGHGALACARAALRGGAEMLAVATATEAAELRASFPDVPILTLGALSEEELEVALAAGAEITVWREGFRRHLARRARALGITPRVHVKYDTGMGRVGACDPEEVLALCDDTSADGGLELAGLWTHFATADERDTDHFERQLARFTELAERARREYDGLCVHAANSAATLREPASHFDMVRCGIAIYGLDPFGADPAALGLEPALELLSYVADVKRFKPGDGAGYGRTWVAEDETYVGVVPIGYGDGWRRGLSNKASVIVDGELYPVVGTISMDNTTVGLGAETAVEPGAEAVLIGRRDGVSQSAEELARMLGTINYEITCGISQRVPRVYTGLEE